MANSVTRPNLFQIRGRGLRVTYSTSSITGDPLLSYSGIYGDQQFRGEEIGLEETAIGMLVTVTVNRIPDAESALFTMLLPHINGDAKFKSVAFHTIARTSIGGPNLVKGPIESYRPIIIWCMAQVVDF
ncbi:MAG: hypothetical protein KIH69_012205 [Anaerolineae bacterium]|nr:hypothetical protein [Anaerolineae bacterium]